MQTTLRINDRLYREAKTEAARQGLTLTRFLEEGIRLRLDRNAVQSGVPHRFPLYTPAEPHSLSDEEIRRIDREEQEAFYLKKINMGHKE